jgi:PAS domain S-box-containing protein
MGPRSSAMKLKLFSDMRLILILCALLLAALFAATAHAHTSLRVAVYHNPPLLDFEDPQQPRGIFIDVLRSAAAEQGWTLVFVPGTFDEGAVRARAGEVDLMPGFARTPEREHLLRFASQPVVHTWGQVYAPEGSSVRSILDLSGKRVVGVQGTIQMQHFERTAARFGVKPTLRGLPDYAAALREVKAGRADALLANPFTGSLAEQEGGVVNTAIMFEPYLQFFAAAPQFPQELLDRLDTHVARLKADPTSVYFRALQQLTEPQRHRPMPLWVKWAALLAAVTFLIGLVWIRAVTRAAERVRDAEKGQRRLAQELTRITDNSLDVIAVLDGSFKILRISRAVEPLWGYRACELEGRSCLDLLVPSDRPDCSALLREIRAGKRVADSPNRVMAKGGRTVRMLWSLTWSEEEGELYAIGRDDTERYKLISQLRDRSAQLQDANEHLRTFAHSVSHDLRAPVAAIAGFTGKVLRDEGGHLQEHSRALLSRAHAASQRMDSIIGNLLRLARLTEAGVRRRPCDITVLCEDVLTCLRNGDPGREVHVSIQPGMSACADRELLRHVFDNLLSNAWKFTSHTRGGAITVGCDSAGEEPVFFVKDNGEGFDMQFAGNLFAPFTRLHDQERYEGAGIGLSIAYRVVAGHGGTIWADSSPAGGATFRFTLGQATATATERDPARRETTRRSSHVFALPASDTAVVSHAA